VAKLQYLFEQTRATLQLARTARFVSRTCGKPLAEQAREIIALHRGPGRLKPFDYYAYELYDDARYTAAQKREFISWRWDRLCRLLNDPAWTAVCDDKLVTYALFRGLGLPHPDVQAFFHPGTRTCGPIPAMRTPQAMADFLRHGARYPLFGKPARDWRGGGASSLMSYDRERDVVLTAQGEEVHVDDYVAAFPVACCSGANLRSASPDGYLFQSRVVQHPLVDRLSGERVSTLRLIVLLGTDGPRLHRVTWKLPVGRNITDHAIGTSGNVKCSVDPATGRVERALRGPLPGSPGLPGLGAYGSPIERHPDSGETLTGVVLPHWDRIVTACLDAAAALPGVRYQGWDIAIGPDGPLFMECNHHTGIAQVAGCSGFYDDAAREVLSGLGLAACIEGGTRHRNAAGQR
jgi:hypothetical protein